MHEHRLVPEPHGAAVAPEHPVLGAERFAGLLRATAFPLHAFQIVRDEPVGACGGVGQPLTDREAQDGLELRTHVEQRACGVRTFLDRFQVDDRGETLDDGSEPLLGDPPLVLDQPLLRDVDHQAAEERGAAFGVANDVSHIAEPDDRAVLGHEPILGVEAPARRRRPDELRDHALPVVGVDAVRPERGVREPFLGGVAEDGADPPLTNVNSMVRASASQTIPSRSAMRLRTRRSSPPGFDIGG